MHLLWLLDVIVSAGLGLGVESGSHEGRIVVVLPLIFQRLEDVNFFGFFI